MRWIKLIVSYVLYLHDEHSLTNLYYMNVTLRLNFGYSPLVAVKRADLRRPQSSPGTADMAAPDSNEGEADAGYLWDTEKGAHLRT